MGNIHVSHGGAGNRVISPMSPDDIGRFLVRYFRENNVVNGQDLSADDALGTPEATFLTLVDGYLSMKNNPEIYETVKNVDHQSGWNIMPDKPADDFNFNMDCFYLNLLLRAPGVGLSKHDVDKILDLALTKSSDKTFNSPNKSYDHFAFTLVPVVAHYEIEMMGVTDFTESEIKKNFRLLETAYFKHFPSKAKLAQVS
jgi:hypothetical protein